MEKLQIMRITSVLPPHLSEPRHGIPPFMQKNRVKEKFPVNITTNFHFLTLLGIEIAVEIEELASLGIVGYNHNGHIRRGMGVDIDQNYHASKIAGRDRDFGTDYSLFTKFFTTLSEKHLSQFQKISEPKLLKVLRTILMIDYSLSTALYITTAIGQKTNAKTTKILNGKRSEMRRWFDVNYAKVSNFPFDFKQLNKTWYKMNQMKYIEFKKYIEPAIA